MTHKDFSYKTYSLYFNDYLKNNREVFFRTHSDKSIDYLKAYWNQENEASDLFIELGDSINAAISSATCVLCGELIGQKEGCPSYA